MEATSTTGNSNSTAQASKSPAASAEANGAAPSGNGPLIPHVSNANTDIAESAKSVLLNVGGRKYEVLRKNLTNFPGSRLWKLVHANTKEEILRVCDRFKPGIDSEQDFVPAEYFFDHNYTSFAEILDAYRSGHLHLQATNCAYTTREDIAYWGIDELLVEPCCAVKYYSDIEICIKELDTEEEEKQREIEREKIEDFGPTWYGKLRKKLWDLFEYPQTSKGAKFIACWSLSMVVISTACFVLSASQYNTSSPSSHENRESTHPELQALDGEELMGISSPTTTTTESSEEGSGSGDSDGNGYWSIVYDAIVWIDAFTAVYFTVEYFIRFTCAPRKLKFFVQPLNLVDLFAILPYIFSFVLDHLSEFHIIGKAGKVVRLVRVTRILRVFKLVRHFAGLQSLFATLKQAQRELGLLVMLVGVCVLTFSSLVYFSEKDEQNWTFLDSFWWGLLTITTVGYGTSTPISGFGRFIGGITALFGVFTITLPVPIVVNSFSNFYKTRLWRSEVAIKRRDRLIHTNNSTKESAHIELNGVQ